MPLYEYECEACRHRFEVIQKFSDAPVATCRQCGGGPVHKLPSSPAIQFKGSGWYITDYARAGKSDATGDGKSEGKTEGGTAVSDSQSGESKSGESKSGEAKSAEAKGEGKSDAKTESKAETKTAPTSDSKPPASTST